MLGFVFFYKIKKRRNMKGNFAFVPHCSHNLSQNTLHHVLQPRGTDHGLVPQSKFSIPSFHYLDSLILTYTIRLSNHMELSTLQVNSGFPLHSICGNDQSHTQISLLAAEGLILQRKIKDGISENFEKGYTHLNKSALREEKLCTVVLLLKVSMNMCVL